MRAHNGQMVVELHRALISYWLNEWYYTTNHAVKATEKMVATRGNAPRGLSQVIYSHSPLFTGLCSQWHASQDSNLHSLSGSSVNSGGRYHSGQMRIKRLPINCGILCNPLDERRWTNEQKAMHRVGLDPTSPQATLDGGLGNLRQD